MKKVLLFASVLVATVGAARAEVNIRIGLPLPPLPHISIGWPAPRVVVSPPAVYYPAPPCAPARVVVGPPVMVPAPVVVAAPRVVFAPPFPRFPFDCRPVHHHHHHHR